MSYFNYLEAINISRRRDRRQSLNANAFHRTVLYHKVQTSLLLQTSVSLQEMLQYTINNLKKFGL